MRVRSHLIQKIATTAYPPQCPVSQTLSGLDFPSPPPPGKYSHQMRASYGRRSGTQEKALTAKGLWSWRRARHKHRRQQRIITPKHPFVLAGWVISPSLRGRSMLKMNLTWIYRIKTMRPTLGFTLIVSDKGNNPSVSRLEMNNNQAISWEFDMLSERKDCLLARVVASKSLSVRIDHLNAEE